METSGVYDVRLASKVVWMPPLMRQADLGLTGDSPDSGETMPTAEYFCICLRVNI